LINKVNALPKLSLVKETKEPQNDPGASSGSGLAYERPRENHPDQSEKKDPGEDTPVLAVVSELEKPGMTEVVKDFYEHRNEEQPQSQSPGLSTRYQIDGSRTKGLLLNKKAE